MEGGPAVRYDPSGRPLPAPFSPCPKCGVDTGNQSHTHACRCCAADESPSGEYGAGVENIMPPIPSWPVSEGPRLELLRLRLPDGSRPRVGLWWGGQGTRRFPLHPLEFPINRLKSLGIGDDRSNH
jgi:hypothetical protein